MTIRDTLISAEQAAEIRARNDRNEAWSEQFRQRNGWIVITAEQQASCPVDAAITNTERGKLEQFEIWRDKPERLFAYVKFWEHHSNKTETNIKVRPYNGCTVTVWTGEPLGYGIVNAVWRSNFGDKRASITLTIAGETYSGTAYLDSGTYCRLRKLGGHKH